MRLSESRLGKIMFFLFLGFLISGIGLCLVSAFHPVGYFGLAMVFLSGVFFGQFLEVEERVQMQREMGWSPIRIQVASEDITPAPQDTVVQVPSKSKDGDTKVSMA